ncbi:hypothetical protein REH65_33095 (plasmid) [Saccharopolyspora sp. ID03-671]|uniref:hypothetical protein n=1 Tax=Saccharopolyspora sp. ID03-671 TaxID=3073066 RepID=UPI0030F493F6
MTIATHWTITYDNDTCQHTEDKDLSHKKPHERAGFARWLTRNQVCRACYLQNRADNGEGREWIDDKQEWLQKRRAAEAAEVQEWEEQTQALPLTGSEKAVGWASRVRYQAMRGLYTHLVEEGNGDEDSFQDALDTAGRITRSSWWLDNRTTITGDDGAPEALLELLNSAAADAGMDCENTF